MIRKCVDKRRCIMVYIDGIILNLIVWLSDNIQCFLQQAFEEASLMLKTMLHLSRTILSKHFQTILEPSYFLIHFKVTWIIPLLIFRLRCDQSWPAYVRITSIVNVTQYRIEYPYSISIVAENQDLTTFRRISNYY